MTAAINKPGATISAAELERRVAIIKRFKELLSQQRDRFRQYLSVLDKQKDIIEKGSPDDLMTHVELEEKIVGDIFAIQKVIDPIEAMYHANVGAISNTAGNTTSNAAVVTGTKDALASDRELPSLRAALEELRAEAAVRSERNRELLAKRMEEIRHEMKTLRANPYAIHRPAYTEQNATLIDIAG